MDDSLPMFLKIKVVAADLGIGYESVLTLIRNGKLPGYKFEGTWRVRAEDLERYKGTLGPPESPTLPDN